MNDQDDDFRLDIDWAIAVVAVALLVIAVGWGL
jgi:hypothetical protein